MNIPKFYRKGDIMPKEEQKTIREQLDESKVKEVTSYFDNFIGTILFIGYLVVVFAIIRFIFSLIF